MEICRRDDAAPNTCALEDNPNFFVLYGPNAATGQHSVIFHSECQINYSCRLLNSVLVKGADSIEVKPEAQQKDLAWVHGRLGGLVFNSSCQSWWMDPKTKKNTFIYPDPMYKYWLRTILPTWSDFDVKKNGRKVEGRSFLKVFLPAMVAGAGIWAALGSNNIIDPKLVGSVAHALAQAKGFMLSISS